MGWLTGVQFPAPASRPVLGPTQLPIQWILGKMKMKMTTHLHLVH